MKKLVLKAGLSYSTKDLKCIKGCPFDVEDEKAVELLATGRFEEIQEVMNDPLSQMDDPDGIELPAEDVAKMSKADLVKLAEAKNIDISDCKNKGDIVDRVMAYLAFESMALMDTED